MNGLRLLSLVSLVAATAVSLADSPDSLYRNPGEVRNKRQHATISEDVRIEYTDQKPLANSELELTPEQFERIFGGSNRDSTQRQHTDESIEVADQDTHKDSSEDNDSARDQKEQQAGEDTILQGLREWMFAWSEPLVRPIFHVFDKFANNKSAQVFLAITTASTISVAAYVLIQVIKSLARYTSTYSDEANASRKILCLGGGGVLGNLYLTIIPNLNKRGSRGYVSLLIGVLGYCAFQGLRKTVKSQTASTTKRGRVDLAEENLKEHQQRLSTQDQNHIHEGQSTEESEDSIVFRTRPKLSPLVKDVLQSSIEGLAVGISFAVGTSLPINSASYKNIDTTIGISTTTAVCLYRLSRDLQEAKFWVRNSYSFSSVFTSKVLMATLALIGGALGLRLTSILELYMLAFTGSLFTYAVTQIAFQILVRSPSRRHHSRDGLFEILSFLSGFYVVLVVVFTVDIIYTRFQRKFTLVNNTEH